MRRVVVRMIGIMLRLRCGVIGVEVAGAWVDLVAGEDDGTCLNVVSVERTPKVQRTNRVG